MHDRLSRRERLLTILFPALLGPSQVLLFGLFTTYQHNESEFLIPFWVIARSWVAVLAAIVAVVVAIGLWLPDRALRRYAAVLFGLGFLLWVQGNLLLADYGPLYGELLDLRQHAWRTPYEIGLWVVGLALCAWFARPVSKVAPLASQVLLGLQLIVLLVSSPPVGGVGTTARADWSDPPPRLTRLSSQRNVIHIVLDGFLSEIFDEIASREGETFDRDFSGFTFFPDHLGAFPTTRASMPAMLSGLAYRNERPFREFREEARASSTFTALYAAGYRINAVMFHPEDLPPRQLRSQVTRYAIPTPYGTFAEYVAFARAQLLDLTLFRHAPHGLKTLVYNDEHWLVQRWSAGTVDRTPRARQSRPSNHVLFVEDFSERLIVAGESPVYLFLHLAVPHPPVVVDGECSFVGQQGLTRATYAGQAQCALTVVRRLLDRLRALGVYDESAIVLTSDHGWRVSRPDHPFKEIMSPAGPMERVALSAMPLLAVKPIAAAGPMKRSYAPTTITDLAATVLDLAGVTGHALPGTSVLTVSPDAPRQRSYAYHSWSQADWPKPYQDVLHVFSVEGRVLNPRAWTFQQAIFAPGPDESALFARQETGLFPAQLAGDLSFRLGRPHVVTYAPHDARSFELSFSRSDRATGPQTLTVRVDGRVAARREVSDFDWHRVTVPLPSREGGRGAFAIELMTDPPAFLSGGEAIGFRYRDLASRR